MSHATKELSELKCGDIIKLNFSPTQGHEQDGYRPAIVLTNPNKQNRLLNGMLSVAPITNTTKDFPLHVNLDSRTQTQGSILMEHHKMVDLESREFKYVEKVPEEILKECKEVFVALYEKLFSL